MIDKQKRIIITGANRGIGFHAAKVLALAGHKVVLTARDQVKAESAAENIKSEVITHQLDVTDEISVGRFTNFVRDHLKSFDVLINNAGAVFDKRDENQGPLPTSVEQLRQTLELNLIGAYSVSKQLIPYMNRKERADIINISSGMGALAEMGKGFPAYRISKTALNALTVHLSSELSKTSIRVNSLCPGWVRTEMGGSNATRSLDEGILGIQWIINEEPDINGKFIRDKNIIEF